MTRIVALHAEPTDPEAYLAYYWDKHMPLVQRVPGVQKIRVGTVLGTPGGTPNPYWMISEVFFEDVHGRDRAMASAEMKIAMDDVPKFAADGQVTIMYCDARDVPATPGVPAG